MKFAHIADTHIRNLKYHKEYREVFSQLYDKLKKEKPDYIFHLGFLGDLILKDHHSSKKLFLNS